MKVNISYSVDLEDVLENLYLLFMREEACMRGKIKKTEKILKSDYEDKNIGEIAAAILEYRKVLSSFDVKLAEISNILNGYYAIKYNPDPGGASSKTNEEEVKNE